MGPDKTVTIKATMPERWVPHFLGMLKTMQNYGSVGMSRKVAIYSDGDGDFHPKFEWDPMIKLAEPITDHDGDVIFDAG